MDEGAQEKDACNVSLIQLDAHCVLLVNSVYTEERKWAPLCERDKNRRDKKEEERTVFEQRQTQSIFRLRQRRPNSSCANQTTSGEEVER